MGFLMPETSLLPPVINLTTAKALGFEIPPTFLRAGGRGDRISVPNLLHCTSPQLALLRHQEMIRPCSLRRAKAVVRPILPEDRV